MALQFVLGADRCHEGRFFVGAPGLAGGLQAVTPDGCQHLRRLLAAHHRDACIGPHPQETRRVRPTAHAVVASAKGTPDDDRELRDPGAGDGGHHLGAIAGNAAIFVFATDHETGDVLQKEQRDAALRAEFDEMRGFQRRFREQDAVVGDDADRIAPETSETADDRRPVARLELVEIGAIDEAGDDLANVEGFPGVGRDHAIQFVDRVDRFARFGEAQRRTLAPVEVADDAAGNRQRMRVVLRVVIDDAGNPGMHIGAAEFFGSHHLAGRRLDQGRPAEEDRSLLLDDDRLVGHCRHIGPARGARTHHDGDLRDAGRREVGLIVEDAAEMLLVGKDLVLHRQESAARIDQIDARQTVLAGDLLRAQVFLDGHRIIGAALHRRIVGNDHAFDTIDAADAGNQRGRRHLERMRLAIHAIGSEL